MNTAFSKAFIIESGGSRYGLINSKLHIDEKMLTKLSEIINEIGSDEFLLIGEGSEGGTCIYRYTVDFCRESKTFLVKANCNGTEWDYFRLDFDNVFLYKNEQKSLTTYLYTPCRIFYSTNSPDDYCIWDL